MQTGYRLDENEKIIYQTNRHWIELVPVAVSTGMLVTLALALSYVSGRYASRLPLLSAGIVLIVVIVLLGIAALIFFVGVWVFRQNQLILTNLHLIQIDQKGLFNRQVSQLSLSRVQDVSGKRAGLLATMLNFGTMEVQTAGEQDKFLFNNYAAPQELADRCLQAHESFTMQAVPVIAVAPADSAAPVTQMPPPSEAPNTPTGPIRFDKD